MSRQLWLGAGLAIMVTAIVTVIALLGGACSAMAANTSGAISGAPRLAFHQGQELGYRIVSHSAFHGATKYGADIQGQLILRVLQISSDGTAKIEMVGEGTGRIVSPLVRGGQPTDLARTPYRIAAKVKPNGSILGLEDAAGKPTSFLALSTSFNAGACLALIAVPTYALFGLQLPEALPRLGRQWTGYHQSEKTQFSGSRFGSTLESLRLRPLAVTFTFVGPKQYEGRDCLVFSAGPHSLGLLGEPRKFYFDHQGGQLVGVEAHVKQFGPQKGDIDLTVRLVDNK